jgi:hypothetical protein
MSRHQRQAKGKRENVQVAAVEAVPQALTIRLCRIRCEWWIALAVALLHGAVTGRYDIFRNELYAVEKGS